MIDDSRSRMYRFMCAMLIITYVFTGWMAVATTDKDMARDIDYNFENIEIIILDPPKDNSTTIPSEPENGEESEVEDEVIEEPVKEEEIVEPEMEYFEIPLSEALQNYIFTLCENNGVDPTIIVAMIFRESTYRPGLIGDGGDSFGLMQIQPKWFQDRMEDLGITNCGEGCHHETCLLNPYQNVTLGIYHVTDLIGTGNSIEWVLMAYNGGPDYADGKAAQGVVTEYAETIINLSNELKGEL